MCYVRTLLQVICLSFVVVQFVQSYNFEVTHITRIRRQSGKNCPKPQFACKSGECINGDKECDGAVDCQDASDESNACHRIKCPPFLFTCNYGACINRNLECDGKPDCRDGSDENTPKCRKSVENSKCTDSQFRCSSGQCIDKDDKCDGKAECDDHSDEIKETCWNVRCPGFTHKCRYGACVNGRAECNGIVECFDGSDEDPTICKTSLTTPKATTLPPVTRPSTGEKGSCVLPPHPVFGKWTIVAETTQQFQPGTSVTRGTILKITCNRNHKVDGNNVVFCDNGSWSSDIPTCLKLCPPRISTATMTVNCIYKHKETVNCTDAVDGTLARFKCAPFYEDLGLKKNPVHICQNGEWDQTKPKCEPVCGQKTVEATPLIINGTNVTKGDYPWQVALYQKSNKALICGGSLLSQKVVLTAAHCVADNKGHAHSKENYIVAVGKYFRKYDDIRDHNDAQFSELHRIFIADEYQGNVQNYFGDIALLITVKVFVLSRRVQPVCLDAGNNYNSVINEYGYVTGWGYTVENDKQSDVLKELKVPAVSEATCRSNLPEEHDIYLTHDKLCAGYLDKSTSVCKGDSGGGLVFKHDGRYWVTGIVSVSPNSPTVDGCDSQQYALYTKVSNYINFFILPRLNEFKP